MDAIAQQMIQERQRLATQPVSDDAWNTLRELHSRRLVSIGVNSIVAKDAWRGETTIGKLGVFLAGLLMLWVPCAFVFVGWQVGLVSIGAVFGYARLISAVSSAWFRKRILWHPGLFHGFYCQGNVGIHLKSTGEHITMPQDWMGKLQALVDAAPPASRDQG